MLPERNVKLLIEKEGFDYFQPMGRKIMKEWIQLNRDISQDYLDKLIHSATGFLTLIFIQRFVNAHVRLTPLF